MAAKSKLWIGVGAYLLTGGALVGCATEGTSRSADLTTAAADVSSLHHQAGQGGEGGEFGGHHEGGEAGGHHEGGEGGEAGGHHEGGEGGEAGGHHEGGEGGEAGGHHEGGEGGEAGGHHEGGEGGEGGERGAVDADQALLVALHQMRGHLWVARVLYREGHQDAALPHFLHPVAEVYEGIEDDVKAHGIPLREALDALADSAGNHVGADAIEARYAEVQQRIDAVAETIPAAKRDSAEFALAALIDLLRTAAHEYDEAVQDGRITNPAEYQDGLGFVMVAQQAIEAMEPRLRERDAEAYERLEQAFTGLLEAWPSVQPPRAAVQEPSQVYSAASRIELVSTPLR